MAEETFALEDLVAVGQIVGVFGVRGEVKVMPLTDVPERFKSLRRVFLVCGENSPRKATVRAARAHKHGFVVRLAEAEDPEQAEALRGCYLMVPRSERVPLPEGQFYIDDLLGFRVVTESGQDLGTIQNVIQNPANDVYQTDVAMIPALKEVVVKVDLEAGEMVVRPPEGLLDPEEA